ncbi:MAG: AraC family transcriptional regulator [Vicinamibacterales bacterium]
MELNSKGPIRPEWMYELRSIGQSFICRTWAAERLEFAEALGWLSEGLPEAESSQELDEMNSLLKLWAIEAARTFHARYHRRFGEKRCRESSVDLTLDAWTTATLDPHGRLASWATAFLSTFNRTHPPCPCERAAAILRSRFRTPPSVDVLAAAVGCSKSVLTRSFRQCYGMTPGEYVARLRLLWFTDAAPGSTRSCAELAADAGYSSYHNLSDALWSHTGLTPGQVRSLSDAQLLDVRAKLALAG